MVQSQLVVYFSLSILSVIGGVYQVIHFLSRDRNTWLACLAVCPIVIAIFLFFFCIFVGQLYRQLKQEAAAKKQQELQQKSSESKPEVTRDSRGYRRVRSVRTLKRRSEMRRCRSVDNIPDHKFPDLIRVRSDLYLSIPRASLSRSRSVSRSRSRCSETRSMTDINNNLETETGEEVSVVSISRKPSSVSGASQGRSAQQPGVIKSNKMTREQIIDLFSSQGC